MPLLMLLAAAAPAAPAADTPLVEWGGYGTLSTYRADINGASLRPDRQAARAGSGGEWRTDGDSRLGLQGRLRLPGMTEAVVQLVSSDTADRGYRPKVEWAYLSWSASPSLTLRVGRQTLPFLRFSETRNVGYAQTPVRPNTAVYGLSTGTPVDGANLSWELDTTLGSWRLDLGAGRSSAAFRGTQIDVRRSLVGAVNWQSGPWSVRVATSDFRSNIQGSTPWSPGLLTQCQNCASVLATRAPMQDQRGRIHSALLVWDQQPWEISAEALWRASSNSVLIPRAIGAYVQVSRRFGGWRAHAAVGRQEFREPALGLLAKTDAPPAAMASIALLDRYLQSPYDLATLQAGISIDLAPRLALKLQQEQWRALRDRSVGRNGLVALPTPPLDSSPATWNGRARLTTVSLDFVF